MNGKGWIAALGWVACTVAAPAALGCGVCLDDKVAAAYDHAVVQRALARGQVVVFCELKGLRDAGTLAQAAKQAARGLRGVDPASVRASRELAVVSFAVDPAVQTPAAAVAALQQKIKATGATPTLLKVLQAGKRRANDSATSRLI